MRAPSAAAGGARADPGLPRHEAGKGGAEGGDKAIVLDRREVAACQVQSHQRKFAPGGLIQLGDPQPERARLGP